MNVSFSVRRLASGNSGGEGYPPGWCATQDCIKAKRDCIFCNMIYHINSMGGGDL